MRSGNLHRAFGVSLALAMGVPLQGGAEPAAKPEFRAGVFCVLVGKKDLKIHAAEIAVSSGDVAWDAKMRREVIGMRTPTPVASTSDFWEPVAFADPGARPVDLSRADCRKLNHRLCGQSTCRQAK